MDQSVVFSQDMDSLHSKCPTLMSTEVGKNGHSSQTYFTTYPATNSSQLQILPTIMSSSQVFLLAGIIPASYNNQLKPIFTNAIPIENIQIPIIPILNVAKEIDCPSDSKENKFNLTPEIPEQIFTLPFLLLEASETHNIQDRNSISSNMEQPTKLNLVEELAKISDHSKKVPLSVEIPELPPPKSLFPLYSTPPGGIILKPLEVPSDQLPATSNFYFGSLIASPQEIPSDHQNTSCHIDQNTSCLIDQNTSCLIDQNTSCLIHQNTSCLIDQNTSCLIDQNTSCLIDQNTSCLIDQNTSCLIVQNTSCLIDRNTSYGVSCDPQVVFSQKIPESATYNYSIPLRYEESNPIQLAAQAHNLKSSIVEQPFMQNRCVGPQYKATNPKIQYSTIMTNLNTAPQF